jgi:hypothetical protein
MTSPSVTGPILSLLPSFRITTFKNKKAEKRNTNTDEIKINRSLFSKILKKSIAIDHCPPHFKF